MADEPARGDGGAPPPSEQLHLPEPSYLPVLVALGVTVALVGVVLSWVVFAIGAVVILVATIRWVRETREDIAELPLEH